jgi:flagellar basal body-associated protein FliL
MADEDQDGEEDRKAADAVASSSVRKSFSRRLFPYLAGGTVSLGLGVGAGIVQVRKDAAKPGEESAEKKRATPAEYPVELKLDLGKTIFNCADNGQLIAGAVTILLEVRTSEKWGTGEKPKLKDAIDPKTEGEYSCAGRIKDALVILLSTKMSGDLRSSRGKEVLKLEILDQMNRILFGGLDREKDPQGVVTNVLFTDFLVQ